MANSLGNYNPVFYAQEALIQLEKALGMAGRVHRGYEEERKSFGRGQTINIRKPSTFTAQNAPSSAQDLDTGTTALVLDHWKEVKFKVSDRELAFTGQKIIDDHIRPAAYALADDVDQRLAALYKDIPWFTTTNAAPGSVVTDVTDPRKLMFNNSVPMNGAGDLHFMVDGTMEQGLIGNAAYAQWQGAGAEGVATQMRGTLGYRYGFEFFANQNVQSHTKGTGSSTSCSVVGATALGATTITIDDTSLTGTVVPGDSFVIAGNTQRYAITNTVTAASNAMVGITFTPALVAAASDNDAATLTFQTTDAENLAFHKNAFALALAPLPEMPSELGANVAVITDPITGLSLRARIYYVGDSSEVHVALDILYGVKTLDPNLACRVQDNA